MSVITLQGKQGIYTFDPHNPSSLLGEGGMGAVFKGQQISIIKDGVAESYNRTVAVKILYRELTDNPANIERAKIEATIQIHHKNLIEIYDFAEQNGIYHTVCEYLSGENLNTKIAQLKEEGKVFTEEEAINIILQVCNGLKELHKNGIIHRDIDPTNIRLLEDGGVKLFDFSIVKKTDSVSKILTTTGGMIGKPHYASPEQILNLSPKDITPSTDIYSVGITLYEMLTSVLPFEGGSESAITEKKTKENLPKKEMLSPEIYEIIKKATNPNRQNRYNNINEFSNRLTTYLERRTSFNLNKKRKRLWYAITIGIAVLLGVGFFIYKKMNNEKITIDYTLIPTIDTSKKKWGFLSQSLDKVVIPFKYDETFFFEGGIAPVSLNNKWGAIDKEGTEVIPIKYEDYKVGEDFWENLYFIKDGLIAVELNKKWGFIDKTGTTIISFKYDDVKVFREGLAAAKLNNKWGFIDKTGATIISFKYDDINHYNINYFFQGLAALKLNDKWGFVDTTGNNVIPFKYDDVSHFSEGLVQAELDQLGIVHSIKKLGFIDKTGNEVIPFKYDRAGNFSEGLVRVELNGKWGFVDKTGNEIIPFKNEIVEDFSEGLARVEKEYLFLNGSDITDSINNVESDVTVDSTKEKWGFIDKIGNEVIPIKYDNIEDFSEGLAAVKLYDKYGFIDKAGNAVSPFKYREVYNFSEGLAAVELNDKWGFIDKTGNEVIPIRYEYVQPFKNGHAFVDDKNSFGVSMYFIDKNGNRILK